MKFTYLTAFIVAGAALTLTSCGETKTSDLTESGLDPDNFVTTVNARLPDFIPLKNNSGMEVCITTFEDASSSLTVPDRDGTPTDVVLGFDSIASYLPENNQTDFQRDKALRQPHQSGKNGD